MGTWRFCRGGTKGGENDESAAAAEPAGNSSICPFDDELTCNRCVRKGGQNNQVNTACMCVSRERALQRDTAQNIQICFCFSCLLSIQFVLTSKKPNRRKYLLTTFVLWVVDETPSFTPHDQKHKSTPLWCHKGRWSFSKPPGTTPGTEYLVIIFHNLQTGVEGCRSKQSTKGILHAGANRGLNVLFRRVSW